MAWPRRSRPGAAPDPAQGQGWGTGNEGAINCQEGENRANEPKIAQESHFCHWLCCNPKCCAGEITSKILSGWSRWVSGCCAAADPEGGTAPSPPSKIPAIATSIPASTGGKSYWGCWRRGIDPIPERQLPVVKSPRRDANTRAGAVAAPINISAAVGQSGSEQDYWQPVCTTPTRYSTPETCSHYPLCY